MKKRNSPYVFLKIRKRPWYVWVLRFFWLLWVILWGDVALGSWRELEPRAFIIALLVFLISLVGGFLIWLWGIIRFRKSRR
ncbi:MAG: hypothetical protein ACE5L7_05345 [Candidatus Aminicenantales bacterium]